MPATTEPIALAAAMFTTDILESFRLPRDIESAHAYHEHGLAGCRNRLSGCWCFNGTGVMLDSTEQEWNEKMRVLEPLVAQWDAVDLSLSARFAADAMGLGSAAALHEWLAARELPPYMIVRDWYYVARLVEVSQECALCEWALSNMRDPAHYDRFVKRVTGLRWREVRQHGARWVKARALGIWRPYGKEH